jgi:hypothetical protein
MKSILKASQLSVFLSALVMLSSCAHHSCRTCASHESKCCMHKDGDKEQCPMKVEKADTAAKEESPAKK